MFRRLIAFVFFLSALSSWSQQMKLQAGDRVAFYGDSITAQRYYTRFVEDFVLTRTPQLHVEFVNAGVPGDTVYGGYMGDAATRLKRDLFPTQPTVVTILLGMNDGYYMPFEQKYEDIFESGYRALLTAVHQGLPHARITLISSTPYDEITHGSEFPHYGDTVKRHASFTRKLATESDSGFSDFHETVLKLTETGTSENKEMAALLIPDRIHPAEATQWTMAARLARDWGFSAVVSSVHLDALRSSPVAKENAQVTQLAFNEGHLRWTQLDGALPLPLNLEDGILLFVLRSSDLAKMDQQILRIEHLPSARYQLKIDNKDVTSFTKEQLASGVNLALLPTPMLKQSGTVDELEKKRAELDRARFLLLIEKPTILATDAVLRAFAEKDARLREEQRRAAQPEAHVFELQPME